jgi:hypothetical protein
MPLLRAVPVMLSAGERTALNQRVRGAKQGSGVFRTYPVLCSMRWQGGIARVVGTGMPRRSCRSSRST